MPTDERPAGAPDDTGFSALWSSDGVTRSFSPTATGVPVDLPYLFSTGQRFGPYQIVRPLGKGGMGQVYEADEIESGRRVAVKLLSRGLGDDEERQRFLREGQLAASLSHPNCVYVFGTTEIQGFPVIAMELVPEGTLKDRVVPDSPMTVGAAVDAVLQVIAGLEAAASIGILHRDVKPSNCFVHRDGRVLVGDFGLSVAAAADSGSAGTILGTPGFASPEQLRGGALDLRSDIYSVGATLFYLLSGRAPFDDRSTTSLIARVASEPPPLLTTVRPELPRRLAMIVAKCLAKNPVERFATYAALRDVLEPFGAARVAPAPIVRRTLAGVVDLFVTGMPAGVIAAFFGLVPLSPSHRGDALIVSATTVVAMGLYYGLLEGHWGASAGKVIFGLSIVDADGVVPGIRRASARALAFALPTQIIVQTITWLVLRRVPDISISFLNVVTSTVCTIVLFCTARRSNGWQGLHDRFTRTRVVRKRTRVEARDRVENARREAAPFAGATHVGPYLIDGPAPAVDRAICIEGFDERLERRVWIEILPPGSPPLNALRRDLDRPARARWLAGRRDGADCWDAYEAVGGRPLRDITAASPQPWSRVRHWLADLAQEVVAGLGDGTLPSLNLDCVWIGHDDRARLLEWSHPGSGEARASGDGIDLPSAQRFLYGAAVGALLGVPFEKALTLPPQTPLPFAARTMLLSLRDAKFKTAQALLDGVTRALGTPAVLPARRRAMQIACSAIFPIIMVVITVGGVLALGRKNASTHDLLVMQACLDAIESADKTLNRGPDPKAAGIKADAEIYLAEHLATEIRNPDTWTQSFPAVGARGGRDRARRALDAHPVRTPEEVRRADATVVRLMASEKSGIEKISTWTGLWLTSIAVAAGCALVVMFLSVLGALITGSGFTFRPFGAALVNTRGQRASRVRALWRSIVTWSPVLVVLPLLELNAKPPDYSLGLLLLETALLMLMVAAAAWAIARPSRGLQDRLSGTRIVPR